MHHAVLTRTAVVEEAVGAALAFIAQNGTVWVVATDHRGHRRRVTARDLGPDADVRVASARTLVLPAARVDPVALRRARGALCADALLASSAAGAPAADVRAAVADLCASGGCLVAEGGRPVAAADVLVADQTTVVMRAEALLHCVAFEKLAVLPSERGLAGAMRLHVPTLHPPLAPDHCALCGLGGGPALPLLAEGTPVGGLWATERAHADCVMACPRCRAHGWTPLVRPLRADGVATICCGACESAPPPPAVRAAARRLPSAFAAIMQAAPETGKRPAAEATARNARGRQRRFDSEVVRRADNSLYVRLADGSTVPLAEEQ